MLQFQSLPVEIFEHILDYFDNFPTYGAFPQVCKGFRDFLASLARRGDIYARHALYVSGGRRTDGGTSTRFACTVFDKLHSVNDKVAEVTEFTESYNRISWYRRGLVHRDDDKPAIVYIDLRNSEISWSSSDDDRSGTFYDENDSLLNVNGLFKWRRNGKPWRAGGRPVVVFPCGLSEWRNENDELHRDGDDPAVIDPVARTLTWYVNGQRHRGGGFPALVELTGRCMWFDHGRLYMGYNHRGELTTDVMSFMYETAIPDEQRRDQVCVNPYEISNHARIRELVEAGAIQSVGDLDNNRVVYKDLYDQYVAGLKGYYAQSLYNAYGVRFSLEGFHSLRPFFWGFPPFAVGARKKWARPARLA
jgi:hypothetical protein